MPDTMIRIIVAGLVALSLAGCGQGPRPPAGNPEAPAAEPPNATSKDFGTYVLHFNALRTSDLTPEVARTYDIVRSPNRAMLNVSVLKKVEGAPAVPVSAEVRAEAVNLNQQMKNLSLRQIREGEAIYYIGDVSVANDETLVFTVHATPESENRQLSVRFTREFFAN